MQEMEGAVYESYVEAFTDTRVSAKLRWYKALFGVGYATYPCPSVLPSLVLMVLSMVSTCLRLFSYPRVHLPASAATFAASSESIGTCLDAIVICKNWISVQK